MLRKLISTALVAIVMSATLVIGGAITSPAYAYFGCSNTECEGNNDCEYSPGYLCCLYEQGGRFYCGTYDCEDTETCPDVEQE